MAPKRLRNNRVALSSQTSYKQDDKIKGKKKNPPVTASQLNVRFQNMIESDNPVIITKENLQTLSYYENMKVSESQKRPQSNEI